ncbi:hypothetical protein IP69_02960 [Bosea sp. AAP35]|nr:hypothetical protein IP69_02960 [Bosea sp. AAP35]
MPRASSAATAGTCLAIPHSDSDAIDWLPTDPPFTTARLLGARQGLLIITCPHRGRRRHRSGERSILTWAAAYDTAGPEQRSRVGHEAWLALQTTPVLRLDSATPLMDSVAAVQAALR